MSELDFINLSIAHLNETTGRQFKQDNKESVKLLKKLYKDKISIIEIRLVVEHKASEWKNDAVMSKFLRPATLFANSNFHKYLDDAQSIPSVTEIVEIDYSYSSGEKPELKSLKEFFGI